MISIMYFSEAHCSVCKALKPKLLEAISNSFSTIEIEVIEVETSPEIAAQNLVFTVPVVLIMIDDKEQYRFARSFSVSEVLDKLQRINSQYENI